MDKSFFATPKPLTLFKYIGCLIYFVSALVWLASIALLNIYGFLVGPFFLYLTIKILMVKRLRSIEAVLHAIFLVPVAILTLYMIFNFKM